MELQVDYILGNQSDNAIRSGRQDLDSHCTIARHRLLIDCEFDLDLIFDMSYLTRFSCLAAFAALAAGCSTSATPTYTSSGVAGYRINCGGVFGDGDLGSCYQKAGEVCESRGYRVMQTSLGSVIIECKPNDTDLPARQ